MKVATPRVGSGLSRAHRWTVRTIAKKHSSVAINPEKIFPVSSFRAANLPPSGRGNCLPNCEALRFLTASLEDTRQRH